MKKSDLLKQKRTAIEADIEILVSKAERSVEETDKLKNLYADVEKYNADIELEEKNEKFLANRSVIAAPVVITKRASFSDYSFKKAIYEMAYRGGLTGLELEMHQEAMRTNPGVQGIGVPEFIINSRSALAASGNTTVATSTVDFIDALRAKLVIAQAGANILTGLRDNLTIPKLTAGAATWEGETDESADHGASFGSVTMSPKRLSTYQTVSKQLLIQSSYDVEQILRNDMIAAVALAVDDAAIEGGATGMPTGILGTAGIGSVVGGASGAAPTWAHIVALEKEVAVDNADLGKLAFITNPKVRAALKATPVGTDQRMVWSENGNTLMGYNAYVTTQVPSDLEKNATGLSAIIFGNFNDLMVGQWGGLDILVDPYTAAKTAQVNIWVNSFWDVAIRNAVSFAAMKDAIA